MKKILTLFVAILLGATALTPSIDAKTTRKARTKTRTTNTTTATTSGPKVFKGEWKYTDESGLVSTVNLDLYAKTITTNRGKKCYGEAAYVFGFTANSVDYNTITAVKSISGNTATVTMSCGNVGTTTAKITYNPSNGSITFKTTNSICELNGVTFKQVK